MYTMFAKVLSVYTAQASIVPDDVPDLLFQSSLTTQFHVKEAHVHINTANKKIK